MARHVRRRASSGLWPSYGMHHQGKLLELGALTGWEGVLDEPPLYGQNTDRGGDRVCPATHVAGAVVYCAVLHCTQPGST